MSDRFCHLRLVAGLAFTALLVLAAVSGIQTATYGLSRSVAQAQVESAPYSYDRVPHTYDVTTNLAVLVVDVDRGRTAAARRADEASGDSIASLSWLVAPRGLQAGDEVFHYTQRQFVESIQQNGLRSGSYATPSGNLSPLQAHIELSLPPNTPLRDAVLRVDVAGLRQAGYEIPGVTRVSNVVRGPGGRVYTMPGGGYELNFPYAIPPEFIKVVR